MKKNGEKCIDFTIVISKFEPMAGVAELKDTTATQFLMECKQFPAERVPFERGLPNSSLGPCGADEIRPPLHELTRVPVPLHR